MIIADDQQPEASHEAQVTKVANSSTDTKAAAEETAQVAKKVSVVLVEMLIYFFGFFQKAPSKKKKSHIHSLAFLFVCLTSLAWHTTMQLNFQPLEGINVSDMKHDVIFVTVCPETVKVNKYNLKPWELNG